MKACVVPVAADDALAWVRGTLDDAVILLRSPLVPEAVFIVNLPDRAGYRELLRQIGRWRRAGAVTLITRTGVPAVREHLFKAGCLAGFQEPTQTRFIAPPAAFASWVAKFCREMAPRRPVAASERCAPGSMVGEKTGAPRSSLSESAQGEPAKCTPGRREPTRVAG